MDKKLEFCARCNRALKSESSKKVGFGPVCHRKHEAEKALVEQSAAAEQKE